MDRRQHANRRFAHRGFTLIEVMITVAIVAILAGVAYPSYVEYVRRGRIAEATAQLAMTRVRLEQFYQDNRNYGTTPCGVAMPTAPLFDFSCAWGSSGNSQSFVITAAGTAGSSLDGFTYTVDDTNAQRTTAFPGASGLPLSCWIQRKGQTC